MKRMECKFTRDGNWQCVTVREAAYNVITRRVRALTRYITCRMIDI